MTTYPTAEERGYIARLARDTGATLYSVGRTRREAAHRLIDALQRQVWEQEAMTAHAVQLEDMTCNRSR